MVLRHQPKKGQKYLQSADLFFTDDARKKRDIIEHLPSAHWQRALTDVTLGFCGHYLGQSHRYYQGRNTLKRHPVEHTRIA
jgi:hypothetical protein